MERDDETAMTDAIGDALAKARGVAELLEAAQAAVRDFLAERSEWEVVIPGDLEGPAQDVRA